MGGRPSETSEPIDVKFETNDYVGDRTPYAKLGLGRFAGGAPTHMQHITLHGKVTFFSFFDFLAKATGRTVGPIFTRNGSKDAFSPTLRPFGV